MEMDKSPHFKVAYLKRCLILLNIISYIGIIEADEDMQASFGLKKHYYSGSRHYYKDLQIWMIQSTGQGVCFETNFSMGSCQGQCKNTDFDHYELKLDGMLMYKYAHGSGVSLPDNGWNKSYSEKNSSVVSPPEGTVGPWFFKSCFNFSHCFIPAWFNMDKRYGNFTSHIYDKTSDSVVLHKKVFLYYPFLNIGPDNRGGYYKRSLLVGQSYNFTLTSVGCNPNTKNYFNVTGPNSSSITLLDGYQMTGEYEEDNCLRKAFAQYSVEFSNPGDFKLNAKLEACAREITNRVPQLNFIVTDPHISVLPRVMELGGRSTYLGQNLYFTLTSEDCDLGIDNYFDVSAPTGAIVTLLDDYKMRGNYGEVHCANDHCTKKAFAEFSLLDNKIGNKTLNVTLKDCNTREIRKTLKYNVLDAGMLSSFRITDVNGNNMTSIHVEGQNIKFETRFYMGACRKDCQKMDFSHYELKLNDTVLINYTLTHLGFPLNFEWGKQLKNRSYIYPEDGIAGLWVILLEFHFTPCGFPPDLFKKRHGTFSCHIYNHASDVITYERELYYHDPRIEVENPSSLPSGTFKHDVGWKFELTLKSEGCNLTTDNYFDVSVHPDSSAKLVEDYRTKGFYNLLAPCTRDARAKYMVNNPKPGNQIMTVTLKDCLEKDIKTTYVYHVRDTCGDPPKVVKGWVEFLFTFVGDTGTVKCSSGFINMGPSKLTCNEDAMWHPNITGQNVCVPICGDPPSLSNGQITPNGTMVGDTSTLSCNKGYALKGTSNLKCTLISERQRARWLPNITGLTETLCVPQYQQLDKNGKVIQSMHPLGEVIQFKVRFNAYRCGDICHTVNAFDAYQLFLGTMLVFEYSEEGGPSIKETEWEDAYMPDSFNITMPPQDTEGFWEMEYRLNFSRCFFQIDLFRANEILIMHYIINHTKGIFTDFTETLVYEDPIIEIFPESLRQGSLAIYWGQRFYVTLKSRGCSKYDKNSFEVSSSSLVLLDGYRKTGEYVEEQCTRRAFAEYVVQTTIPGEINVTVTLKDCIGKDLTRRFTYHVKDRDSKFQTLMIDNNGNDVRRIHPLGKVIVFQCKFDMKISDFSHYELKWNNHVVILKYTEEGGVAGLNPSWENSYVPDIDVNKPSGSEVGEWVIITRFNFSQCLFPRDWFRMGQGTFSMNVVNKANNATLMYSRHISYNDPEFEVSPPEMGVNVRNSRFSIDLGRQVNITIRTVGCNPKTNNYFEFSSESGSTVTLLDGYQIKHDYEEEKCTRKAYAVLLADNTVPGNETVMVKLMNCIENEMSINITYRVKGSKSQTPRTTSSKSQTPRTTSSKSQTPRTTSSKSQTPRTTSSKSQTPRTTSYKSQAPRTTSSKSQAPRSTSSKSQAPRTTTIRVTKPTTSGGAPAFSFGSVKNTVVNSILAVCLAIIIPFMVLRTDCGISRKSVARK